MIRFTLRLFTLLNFRNRDKVFFLCPVISKSPSIFRSPKVLETSIEDIMIISSMLVSKTFGLRNIDGDFDITGHRKKTLSRLRKFKSVKRRNVNLIIKFYRKILM